MHSVTPTCGSSNLRDGAVAARVTDYARLLTPRTTCPEEPANPAHTVPHPRITASTG